MVNKQWVKFVRSYKLLSGIRFCGMMYIEGALDGLWSRLASDVIVCIVDYWELFQVVLCADCVVIWTNYNFICILVLTIQKMATWLAETCPWSLCNKITFVNPSAFLGLLNEFYVLWSSYIYIYIYIYVCISCIY